MDNFDKAIKRIKGECPKDPIPWIFTTPDKGKTLYRAMRSDVCPEEFKDSSGQSRKQLYSVNGEKVARDEDYGKQEIEYGKA